MHSVPKSTLYDRIRASRRGENRMYRGALIPDEKMCIVELLLRFADPGVLFNAQHLAEAASTFIGTLSASRQKVDSLILDSTPPQIRVHNSVFSKKNVMRQPTRKR